MVTTNKQFKRIAFRSHLQVALLPDQEDRVEAYSTDTEALWSYLMDMVDSGCTITISPNERGGFTAAVQAIHPDHKSAGYAIYANAPTPQEAATVLVFKLENVGPKLDWSQKSGESTEKKYR